MEIADQLNQFEEDEVDIDVKDEVPLEIQTNEDVLQQLKDEDQKRIDENDNIKNNKKKKDLNTNNEINNEENNDLMVIEDEELDLNGDNIKVILPKASLVSKLALGVPAYPPPRQFSKAVQQKQMEDLKNKDNKNKDKDNDNNNNDNDDNDNDLNNDGDINLMNVKSSLLEYDNLGSLEFIRDAGLTSNETLAYLVKEISLQKPTNIRTAFDVDIESLDDKGWRYGNGEVSDYFNYGLNEHTWKMYAENQMRKRLEFLLSEAREEKLLEQKARELADASRKRKRQQMKSRMNSTGAYPPRFIPGMNMPPMNMPPNMNWMPPNNIPPNNMPPNNMPPNNFMPRMRPPHNTNK